MIENPGRLAKDLAETPEKPCFQGSVAYSLIREEIPHHQKVENNPLIQMEREINQVQDERKV